MSPWRRKRYSWGKKQWQRWHLIKMVEGRKITLREAGEKMKWGEGFSLV